MRLKRGQAHRSARAVRGARLHRYPRSWRDRDQLGSSGSPVDELCAYSEWVLSSGVTGYLCSLAAPDDRALIELVKYAVEALMSACRGLSRLASTWKAPLSTKKRKVHLIRAGCAPSLEEAEAALAAGRGWIRQITLAPELPGAGQLAARCREEGVVVSLGHTNSDYAAASAALRGNFTHVTHTFNAQSGFHHREPGFSGPSWLRTRSLQN